MANLKFSYAPSDFIQHTSDTIKGLISSLLVQDNGPPPLPDILSCGFEPTWDNFKFVEMKLQEVLVSIETLHTCLSDANGLFTALTTRREDMLKKLQEKEKQTPRQANLPSEIISHICSLSCDKSGKQSWEEVMKTHESWGPYFFQSSVCRIEIGDLVDEPLAKLMCPRFSHLIVDITHWDWVSDLANDLEEFHDFLEPAISVFNKWNGVALKNHSTCLLEECRKVFFGQLWMIFPHISWLDMEGRITIPTRPKMGSHKDNCLGCSADLKAPRCTYARMNIDDVLLFCCMLPSLSHLSLEFNETKGRNLRATLSNTVWPLVHTLEMTNLTYDTFYGMEVWPFNPHFFLDSPRVDSFPNLRKLVLISVKLKGGVIRGLVKNLTCPHLETLVLGDLAYVHEDDSVKPEFQAGITEMMESIDGHCKALKQLKFYVNLKEIKSENRQKSLSAINSLILSALTPSSSSIGRVPIPTLSGLSLPYDDTWHADPTKLLRCLSERRALDRAINKLELTALNFDGTGRSDAQNIFCARLEFYAKNIILARISSCDFQSKD